MLPYWHFRPQLLPDGSSPQRPASLFATAPRPSSSRWRSAAAPWPSSSRWLFATAPWPAPALASSSTSAPGQSSRRPASNKPHSAEKSTPVWLAIWRTWAGFANSQLLPDAAALSSMQGPPRSGNSSAQTSASLHPSRSASLAGPLPFTRGMGAHGLCGRVPDSAGNACSLNCRCSDKANLSTHLQRLPTPPTYLRRMRLLPGCVRGCWVLDEAVASQGRRCWVLDEAVASQGRRCWVANNAASCPWHTSCKSPRARILVLGTAGAHWPARWPQFVLTERVAKS